MLNADEVRRGVGSAWALFMGRREAIRAFDTSYAGFWRSFQAIILVLPIYVLFIGGERRLMLAALPEGAAFDDVGFAIWRLVALVVDWAAFPLAMALISRPLGFAGRYVRLIVAFNWGGPIVAVLMALPAILYAFGAVAEGGATMLLLASLILVIRFRFITARAALECAFGPAVALVAIELLLSLVIGQVISRLAGY